MPVAIFCGDCGASGAVNKVTANLRCRCGSDNLGLDGVDPKPAHLVAQSAGGTGWGKPMPDPTQGWNEYAGPLPETPKRSAPVADAMVCPACNGTGYDLIDKTVCRECDGTGIYHPPTSERAYNTLDPHTQGPPSGGARWQGKESSVQQVVPTTTAPTPAYYANALTYPATNTSSSATNVTMTITPTAARPSIADPYGTAEYQNEHYGPAEGREVSRTMRTREPRSYADTGQPYVMNQSVCPNCGHSPTELRKDRYENAWAVCPNCGPLANIDKRPDVNPYAWPPGFTPDRKMKTTSAMFGRTRKTGKLLAMLAAIHEHNDLDPIEAVSLARQTLIAYPEEQ